MNVKRWMRNWQSKFSSLGVELIVADVAQSSVVVNVAEKTIILAPYLPVSTAQKVLDLLYKWWEHHPEKSESESFSLVSC
jgi:hypothetical protein